MSTLTEDELGIRAMTKLAFRNAAALIDNMDLEQLYGNTLPNGDANEEVATEAQRRVVAYLRKKVLLP